MPRKHFEIVNANGRAYMAYVTAYEKQPQPVMPEPIFRDGVIPAALRFYGIATSIYVFDYKMGRGSLESILNGISVAVTTELGFQAVLPLLAKFIVKRMQARKGIQDILYTLPEEGF